jgi:hypothetical protein
VAPAAPAEKQGAKFSKRRLMVSPNEGCAVGDGDPGARDPECLFYYTLDKKTLRFTRRVISDFGGGVGTGMQICVADMNGDGRPDVVVAGKTGTWLLVNEGLKK